MNNYDRVFAAIKSECEKQKSFAEISCFDKIARIARVPPGNLPLYLNHLQDIGLIKYSVKDNYIHLTAKGHERDI